VIDELEPTLSALSTVASVFPALHEMLPQWATFRSPLV
jgi:hypothetical protein